MNKKGPPIKNGQAKKLVIKPLRARPVLPDDFEASSWAKLQEAVRAVQCATPVHTSLEELYRLVEDMCLHKLAPRLYDLLRCELDGHAATTTATLASWASAGSQAFLPRLASSWRGYCDQLILTRQIFLCLDRSHMLNASNSSQPRSLFDLGLHLFRTHMHQCKDIESVALDGILSLIAAERSGESIDRQLARQIVTMYSSLGLYEDGLQNPTLKAAATHYALEGTELALTMEVPAYLIHAEKRLQEENSRCDTYLEPSTRKALVATVEEGLLRAHLGALIERGFDSMISENKLEDLGRLYSLCNRIDALEALRQSFKSHIKRVGSAVVLDTEKDPEMIVTLLDFKTTLDKVLEGPFKGHAGFGAALKEAFEQFINQRANRPAELLAKHIDSVMRGTAKIFQREESGGGGSGGGSVESAIDSALVLFRFIQGKDVFEAFYKNDLAKRLLLGKSASIDAEKTCISKLKFECGSQFTNKLEGMFKDVDLSHDVMTGFRQAPIAASAGVDMSVNVLTSGFWPSYPVSECVLPEELSSSQNVFKDFYLSKHTGRRLVWYNSLATCLLKAKFDSGTKELSVSLFQAAVLMLFNDSNSLSYKEIAAALQLEEKELKRTLQSLACGRDRVLTKEPKGKEVEEDDMFAFNSAYSSRLYRVKINSVQLKETKEENKKTNEAVIQDRQHQIDAAVVRIMKTRKTLSHKLLVNELMTQLKFPVQSNDLKKRIESLIDREYMERDPNDAAIYLYLA